MTARIHCSLFAMMAGIVLAGPCTTSLAESPRFDEVIRPILAKHCGECHFDEVSESGLRLTSRSNLIRGGDSGEPAIVVGKSESSHLVRLITGADAKRRMPPDGDLLTKTQIEQIKRWIDSGAVMSSDDESSHLKTDHWSFQPIVPLVPKRDESEWSRNAIDSFVIDKLRELGLEPSPIASRTDFLRRIHFTTLGLPPSPEVVSDFVQPHRNSQSSKNRTVATSVLDSEHQTYDRLVDRMLASPHFGERWAQHWLDVVRFGETDGYETNRERPTAWRYRDYVIDALNRDLAYDKFVREQIAGDAFGVDVGTGFLVAGPYDIVKSPDENLTLMQRQDELADVVNTTSTTFLGMTLGCARCHNHKFDPISQKDFYAVQAVFAGVQHGERTFTLNNRQELALGRVEKQIAELRDELTAFIARMQSGYLMLDDERLSRLGSRGVELVKERISPDDTKDAKKSFPDDGSFSSFKNQRQETVLVYRPFARGRFRIWLSWGCGNSSLTADARYLIDEDGDLATRDDRRLIATVDQRQFANGESSTSKTVQESGFYNGGIHELKPRNALVLQSGESGELITADEVLLEAVESEIDTTAERRWTRAPLNREQNIETLKPSDTAVQAKAVRFLIEQTTSAEPCIDELEVWSGAENVALQKPGVKVSASGTYPNNSNHKLEHINDGKFGNEHSWISNESGHGWVRIDFAEPANIHQISWGRDRTGQFRDRLATNYRIDILPANLEEENWKTVASSADRFPIRSLIDDELRYDFGEPNRETQGRRLHRELRRYLEIVDQQFETPSVYAGQFQTPPKTHRLYRGDPFSKREEVAPDAIEILGSLALSTTTPEQERRVALAEWLTDARNPLTARVIVNRIWQFHFGQGIVATPSDFGKNGVEPSHPTLLDWLAAELIRSNWSMKHIHRLILTSATYRQSNSPRPEAAQIDASCRFLWRFPPRRLEAEAIRDSMLSVSGSIDRRMSGPGFSAFRVDLENVRHYFPKQSFDLTDWRRMIYMTKVRQEKDSVFGAFDCPDASQVMPKRSRSTTPLQALNLFNSPFVIQQAEFMSRRLQRHSDHVESQIHFAFQLSFGRKPDARELTDAAQFMTEHGPTSFCRALLNSNEFLFIP